jgi:hypothetical protein
MARRARLDFPGLPVRKEYGEKPERKVRPAPRAYKGCRVYRATSGSKGHLASEGFQETLAP